MNHDLSLPKIRWGDPNYCGPLTEKAILEKTSEMPIENTDWLIPGWLARGEEHVLAGMPNFGKGFLVSALAARISNPDNHDAWLPEPQLSQAGGVVIVNKEDSGEKALTPRLLAAGANLEQVFILRKIKTVRGYAEVNLAEHTDDLIDTLRRHNGIQLLVIDNLTSLYLRDGVKKAPSLSMVLSRLRSFAEERGFALLLITHLKKSATEKEPLANISGSLSVGSAPRHIMQVARYSDNEGQTFVLTRSKTSNCANDGGYVYSIEKSDLHIGDRTVQTAKAKWIKYVEGTARELLNPSGCTIEKQQRTSKLQIACSFIEDFLLDGPKAKKEVEHAAAERGIAPATLGRAAQTLSVLSYKETGAGQFSGFLWSLPDSDEVEEHGHPIL